MNNFELFPPAKRGQLWWSTNTGNAVSFTALPRQLLSPNNTSKSAFLYLRWGCMTPARPALARTHPKLARRWGTPYCILATYLRWSFPRTEMEAFSTKEGSPSSVTARSGEWVVVGRFFQNSFTSQSWNQANRGTSWSGYPSSSFWRHEEQFWVAWDQQVVWAESFPSETLTGASLTSPSHQARCNKKLNHEC